MGLKISGYCLDNAFPRVPGPVNIRRLNAELICYIRHISEETGKDPVVVGTVEVGLGGIAFQHILTYIHRPPVVVQKVVGLSYVGIGRSPY